MASDKRSFSAFNDRKEFPGRIVNNTFKFPKIEYKVISGKFNFWEISIDLIGRSSKLHTVIDWDTTDNIKYPITKDMFDIKTRIPSNIIARIWVERGVSNRKGETKYKKTRDIPTYIKKGKNIGKKTKKIRISHI